VCGAMLRYTSRSSSNRWGLALVFLVLAFAVFAHIASYFGVVFVSSRSWQNLLTWVLFGFLLWTLFQTHPSVSIPQPWPVVIAAVLIYSSVYGTVLPIRGPQAEPLWPVVAQWLRLDTSRPSLLYARVSSAAHVAMALILLVDLWFRPPVQK
jgi:hypothetical protein